MGKLRDLYRAAQFLWWLVLFLLGGCFADVAGAEPSRCPDHAIPAFTCDPPLAMQCIFEPNVALKADGSCVVDLLTGCQPEGFHPHFEFPYDGGASSAPGQIYGSTCTFMVP